jgi:hypothetical protein
MAIRKLGIYLFFLINTVFSVNAEPIYDFSLQLVNFKTGIYLNTNNITNSLSAEVFNVYFENKYKKYSFKISPFNINTSFNDMETNNTSEMHFLNICTYWNLWSNWDNFGYEYILGPFFSLRYLSLVNFNRFDFQNIDIKMGIKYILKLNSYDFIGNNFSLGMEIGYNFNHFTRHGLYLSMSIDMVEMFLTIGRIFNFVDSITGRINIIKI